MKKAFLSHSSSDKFFVERVAELIGYNNCIIDACEFEIGMKNIDEIFKGIDKSDIFVYFISEASLESEWVKKELNIANEKIDNFAERQIQIYPVIIDKSILYSDERIAEYLRVGMGSYNIRHIHKPEIVARKIKTQLVKLEMAHNRLFAEKKTYFYGRDKEKMELKSKIDDVLNERGLRCLVVAGIPGIGRKSFINAALKEARIIEQYYFPIVISLHRNDSIDVLLCKLTNIGIGEYSFEELSCLNNMEMKIDVLVKMLTEIQDYREFLVIEDNECIVRESGCMTYWFEQAVSRIKSKLSLAVVSELQLDEFKYRKNQDIAYISLKELSKSETMGMLRTYSELEGIPFELEDREFISGCLTGYPPQVEYCVDLAKSEGIAYVRNNSYKVRQMPEQISSKLIDLAYNNFEDKDKMNCLLAVICRFGTIPVDLFNIILKLDDTYREAFYRLRSLSICYYIGNEKEYIKLNSFLQNFVERTEFVVLSDVENVIKNNLREFEQKINDEQYTDELDYSEVSYYVKELLKEEKKVPSRFLYGAIFLQSLIGLYNSRGYDKVIRIVDTLIEEGQMNSYEKEIEDRIMYYYCLALARRKKNEKFGKVILHFDKEDKYITYNFLQGYHYRVLGQFVKAEQFYQNVLRKNPRDIKTRRELVFIYISNQQYELAFELAKSNYKQNKNNIHYMQAYFDCLVYKNMRTEEDNKDLNEIVETVTALYQGICNNNMYYQILAKYYGFVEQNLEKAVFYIDEGIQRNNDGVISYLLKEKFDVYEHLGIVKGMEQALNELKAELKRLEMDDCRLNCIVDGRQALLKAHQGKEYVAIQLELFQNPYLAESAKEKIMSNVKKIIEKQSGRF